MAMLRKNDPLYFRNIGNVYPRIKRFVVSPPLDEMLFNTVLVTCAHYFSYLKLGLGWYSYLDKLIIVKLAFDWPILHVRMFLNRLGHALNNLDNSKYFS